MTPTTPHALPHGPSEHRAAEAATRRHVLLLGAAALLPGCAAAPPGAADAVSNMSPNAGPWRSSKVGDAEGVMLEGHDAVAYFRRGAAIKGDPAHAAPFHGVTWYFATAENRAEFMRRPEAYMPQFGGYCSNGINYAIPWGGGGAENSWRIYRGKLYVFGGQKARDHFEMDTELNIKRAHFYWNAEIAGSNAIWVRYKRLALRVPHYKSDAALQGEWEARRTAGTLPVMPGRPQVVPAGA